MPKVKLNDYKFYDISEMDLSVFTDEEREIYVKGTMEILNAYKKKMKHVTMLVSLVSGLLWLRDGEFVKVTGYRAKYNKGNCKKEELRVIKKVFSTYKKSVWFKAFISVATNTGVDRNTSWINPHVAVKK